MVSDLPFCCRVCVSALPPSVVNAFLSVAATPLDATIGLAKWTQAICLRTDLELKVCSKYFTTPQSDVIVIRPHNERGLATQQKRAIKHIAC